MYKKIATLALIVSLLACMVYAKITNHNNSEKEENYQKYLNFLDDVYSVMRDNYYRPVSQDTYLRYIQRYKTSVLDKIDTSTFIPTIAQRGAGLMIEALKTREDHFSTFIPPKIAKDYSNKIYGYKPDLGITGELAPAKGFLVNHVQKHCNAYKKGLRKNDIILAINNIELAPLSISEIENLLNVQLETTLDIKYSEHLTREIRNINVLCEKYFKETLINLPVKIPNAICLKLASFNQETHNDLKEYIKNINQKEIKLLILDLTDNPGGPPLSVREMSGFFLPEGSHLFYYKKKNVPEFGLIVPASKIKYTGNIIVVINKKSGSAAELLAGTLQAYKRAIIIGASESAGFAFLKGTFNFDDGSMLAIITGDSYLFNGKKISTEGITPDIIIPENVKNSLEYIENLYITNKKMFNY
ncbi:MAG: S41 family peptidase [Candidatus Omnitrophica bacterium]|nr:S41 family peptidase [Candidatus Omnitrophota bacterium]MDD5081237.1 S41 family peptidase [Candidatus Omnitrophota bacterium]